MNAGLPSIRCPLTKAADDAISFFGDENAESVVPLRDGRFKTTGTAIGSCRPFAASAALASRRRRASSKSSRRFLRLLWGWWKSEGGTGTFELNERR